MNWNARVRLAASGIAALVLVWGADNAGGNAPRSLLSIDASRPAPTPVPLPFPAGGKSPDGHSLSVNNRYLLLDGKPWLPVMGEFHYSRYPADEWEQEILKMKAGGLRIVSTYVFWIHHEELEGEFDWSGQRDLRRFVELCGKHGMYVWVRVGPWAHGEARNGGLPDWLLLKSAVRQNDPAYLKYVARYYGQIGTQLRGLFWKDGGPIIGVQIENEYHSSGAGRGAQHILTLKQMAQQAGLDAPFYTITGWDNASVPDQGVMPVFGGYADAFWDRGLAVLPPNPNFFFTPVRCEENVGNNLKSKRPDIDSRFAGYPFFTAEMGGGMEQAYHRRPILSAEDTAAMEVVKLGDGVTLYGYYMFHGGTNPEGKRTTLQESQATAYPNDVPVKTYDFQAPLTEFGQMNPSFRELKTVHLFLRDFGAELAPMTASFPDKVPGGRDDNSTPRATARTDGNRGYIFLNNYQRNYPQPEKKEFQVRLKLASGQVDVPHRPVDIPGGVYTFWPVNLDLQGATLEYATAQPVTRLDDPATYIFMAWPGIAPEFAFRAADVQAVTAPHARVKREEGRIFVDQVTPGSDCAIEVRGKNGARVQLAVLSRDGARNLWKARLGGRERLVLSAADLFFDGDSVHVRSSDAAKMAAGLYPPLAVAPAGFHGAVRDGIFTRYAAHVEAATVPAQVQKLVEAGKVPPVKMGKEVAMAPDVSLVGTEFAAAARWSIRVAKLPAGLSNVYLRISYRGDIGRAYNGAILLTDDFYKGTPWWIGLRRIPRADLERGIEVRILPLRQDAPIYLAAGARPELPVGGQIAVLDEARVIPEYEAVLHIQR